MYTCLKMSVGNKKRERGMENLPAADKTSLVWIKDGPEASFGRENWGRGVSDPHTGLRVHRHRLMPFLLTTQAGGAYPPRLTFRLKMFVFLWPEKITASTLPTCTDFVLIIYVWVWFSHRITHLQEFPAGSHAFCNALASAKVNCIQQSRLMCDGLFNPCSSIPTLGL